MTTGLMIEGLVIILLIATIVYCSVLSGRLKKLKAEESALRSTIAELLTATELAERAIQGLKTTAHEHQKTLGMRVRDAERLNVDLQSQLENGEHLLQRLLVITKAGNAPTGQQNRALPPQRRKSQAEAVPETKSQPRTVSELAAEATARINALRSR